MLTNVFGEKFIKSKPDLLDYKVPDKNVRRTLVISGKSLKTDNKPFLVAYTISFRTPISEKTAFDLLNDILRTTDNSILIFTLTNLPSSQFHP